MALADSQDSARDSSTGTPPRGLQLVLFYSSSLGVLALLLSSAAMKAIFVFSDPFWNDQLPIHWILFASLIPLELLVCGATILALFLVRIRNTSVLLGTTAASLFLLGQVWYYLAGVESCFCFGTAEIPRLVQFGVCLVLAITGGFFLLNSRPIEQVRFVRLPIRLDVAFWIVATFLSVVYFYRTDEGQILAGFQSPSDLKFKFVEVQSTNETRDFVFEVRNESSQPVTITSSKTSCICVSTSQFPIRLEPYKKALLPLAVKLANGRQEKSEFVRFFTDNPRQIQVRLELPAGQ